MPEYTGIEAAIQVDDTLVVVRNAVERLRCEGIHDLVIATVLVNVGGALLRIVFPHDHDLRTVMAHATEVVVTGHPVPFPTPSN